MQKKLQQDETQGKQKPPEMQFVRGWDEIFLPPFNEFSRQLPKYAKVKGPVRSLKAKKR